MRRAFAFACAAPPSFFKTGPRTAAVQSIVDTYGVPRYKEVNPGLFSLVTFPFLFGVMFGDVGHGLALALFAGWLLWQERALAARSQRKQLDEIFDALFQGRYLLLAMGLFAAYCGLVYNDFMSNPLFLSHSRWRQKGAALESDGTVYPFGIDPVRARAPARRRRPLSH